MMYAARSVARFILPIWAAALQTVFAGRYYDHPTPWCKNCLAIAVHDAPGIGFDLTTSYGTAVAHLYNGTIVDIAKVPASSDYQALISRLHNTAPPASPSRLERLQRWWNKYRGLPATPEVGILASLLSSLKSTTSAALSTSPITHVAITHPPIPALFTSLNLADAFLHAGLQHNWLGDARGMQPKHISQSHATLAGNGMGLCESYTDLLRCWGEGAEMPERWVLYASLTRHVLDVRVEKMGDAFQRLPTPTSNPPSPCPSGKFTTPSTFTTPDSKQSLAADITTIYTRHGLPAFYVVVNFHPVPSSNTFIGGQTPQKPFVRFAVDHIAVHLGANEETMQRISGLVASVLRPHIEKQG
ncbi:hypothetical protein N0V88_001543 [Collariella sp. IMI 366227]|nr:hypothetical protein N0V88_001543 [Collariella sp. IMI 366227]